MRVYCLVQAREGSTRFPRKVYADLGGRSVIDWVFTAAQQITGVTEVIGLWPDDYPQRKEEDVLGRYADAARELKADVVMRITGDCPFFDPQVGTIVLTRYLEWPCRYDYVSNVWPVRTFPDGLDCEVFSTELLYEADKHATAPDEREHVTTWMQRWERLSWYNVMLPVDWSHVRLTVDEPRDLDFLREVLRYAKGNEDVSRK